jgi:hypothetical protein
LIKPEERPVMRFERERDDDVYKALNDVLDMISMALEGNLLTGGETALLRNAALIRPLAVAKLKLRFGVARSGTFSQAKLGRRVKNRQGSSR